MFMPVESVAGSAGGPQYGRQCSLAWKTCRATA